MKRHAFAAAFLLLAAGLSHAQAPSARQVEQERSRAEVEVPQLVKVLDLKPGMAVADVGAGFGAMTIVLGQWIGPGQVFATDVGERQLTAIRDYVKREGLTNVTVIEGATASTNLPDACCDAIFMRDVYHHITEPDAFIKSLFASLKPGGRLAIIDFVARKGTPVPDGVRANREGHGVPIAVVIQEVTAQGFAHVSTLEKWPPESAGNQPLFLTLFRRPQ